MGDPVDVSLEFEKQEPLFFVGNWVTSFDPAAGTGTLEWVSHVQRPALSFNKLDLGFTRVQSSDFAGTEYDENPSLPFSISFVSPRTVRLRIATRSLPLRDIPSLMLVSDPPRDRSWKVESTESAITYTGARGRRARLQKPGSGEMVSGVTGRFAEDGRGSHQS